MNMKRADSGTPDGADPWSCLMTPIGKQIATQRSLGNQSNLNAKVRMAVDDAVMRGAAIRKLIASRIAE